MGDYPAIILAALLVLLLLSAGVEDVRFRTIANWKNAAIASLAVPWWFAIGIEPWPGMAIQIGVALATFAMFTGAFALGMMGGGDVKMIAALALWFPLQSLFAMLLVMAIAGGVVTLVMLIDHRRRNSPGQPEIPYGVAIACAALITLHEPLFNHFA